MNLAGAPDIPFEAKITFKTPAGHQTHGDTVLAVDMMTASRIAKKGALLDAPKGWTSGQVVIIAPNQSMDILNIRPND